MNNEKNQKKWIEEIQTNLKLRGRSEKTFINYKCQIMKFFRFYDESINLKKLKEKDIIDFLNKEYLELNRSKNTYNLAVAAIRLFYLVCFGISLNRLLIPSAKLDKKLPVIMPKDIFLNIFNNEKNLKHKCWLILAFCSGLRVEEVANVRIEDLNSKEHKIRIFGKGNKERYSILPDISIKILALYCKKKNIKSGYLFKGNEDKEVMNSKTIINYFSSLKVKYNLDDRITFHSLRHSFATYFLMNGGSLLDLQAMLGHTNINTTTIYLHIIQDFNNLGGINYV